MEGDHRRFGRADGVEEQWRIVDDGAHRTRPRSSSTAPGTWGPAGAERLAAPVGGWVEPLAED